MRHHEERDRCAKGGQQGIEQPELHQACDPDLAARIAPGGAARGGWGGFRLRRDTRREGANGRGGVNIRHAQSGHFRLFSQAREQLCREQRMAPQVHKEVRINGDAFQGQRACQAAAILCSRGVAGG